MVTRQSPTSPRDVRLPRGCVGHGPGQQPVQQHELASTQITPDHPCPLMASGQPAGWANMPRDTNLLPTAVLPQCCSCITARWSGNGWFAPIMGKAHAPSQHHPKGIICRLSDRNEDPFDQFGPLCNEKYETQTPSLFFFSKLWHEQRVFSPDELFSVQQQPK